MLITRVDTWLNEPIFIERPELFEQQITGDFKKDMESTTRAAVIKVLFSSPQSRTTHPNESGMVQS